MAKGGYVKFHRKLLEHAIFYKADYYQLWSFILLSVNHKDNTFIWNDEMKTVKKGSGIFSQKLISEKLKISISTVHRALKFLENEKQIEIKSTNKFTEIKVINWKQYQEVLENENQNENKKKPSGKPPETNKNDNNEENEKNYISIGDEKIFDLKKWVGEHLMLQKPNWQTAFDKANVDECLDQFMLHKAFQTFKDIPHFRNSFAYTLKAEQEKNEKKKGSAKKEKSNEELTPEELQKKYAVTE